MTKEVCLSSDWVELEALEVLAPELEIDVLLALLLFNLFSTYYFLQKSVLMKNNWYSWKIIDIDEKLIYMDAKLSYIDEK